MRWGWRRRRRRRRRQNTTPKVEGEAIKEIYYRNGATNEGVEKLSAAACRLHDLMIVQRPQRECTVLKTCRNLQIQRDDLGPVAVVTIFSAEGLVPVISAQTEPTSSSSSMKILKSVTIPFP